MEVIALSRAEIDESADTIDTLETALSRALLEAEPDDVRYQIRTALQKVEVLREFEGTNPVQHR